MFDFLIIGGGLSGLVIARELKLKGFKTLLLEKEEELGGNVRTRYEEGFLYEEGPQTILADEEVLSYLKGLRLKPLFAKESAKRRFILKDKKLYELNPKTLIFSNLLSLRGRLRILLEPFIGEGKGEESLEEFVKRRFGEEFLRYIVEPFVSGVYAGDVRRLSVKYAFKRLYEMERKYKSLIKAGLKLKRFAPKSQLISFKGGLKELIEKLKGDLNFSLGDVALRILKKGDYYEVISKRGKYKARSVVITSPAYTLSYLLSNLYPSLAKEFEKINYPPLAVVNLGVVGEIPEGFGFLVPRDQGLKILGVLFPSKIFQGRAKEGYELITAYVGGQTFKEVEGMKEEEILEKVKGEVKEILRVEKFVFERVKLWKRSIPQYELNYGRFFELAKEVEDKFKGIYLGGNYLFGVSTADCIKGGVKKAGEILYNRA